MNHQAPGSMASQADGGLKYPGSKLLASSTGLGWSTISAELRSHPAGESPAVVPRHVEIHLAVSGSDSCVVRRTAAGQVENVVARTGTLCMSPIGIGEDVLTLSAPLEQTLHLYLPTNLFQRLNSDFELPVEPAYSVRYFAGFRDEVMEHIALSILSEMTAETAGGRLYVEMASMTLAARLLQKYYDGGTVTPTDSSSSSLNRRRLRAALEYVAANIENDITLADLARVANYSPFHFARQFKLAMGISPHRYISKLRLEKAMAQLAARKLPLAEIAQNAHFSSQASFTRAFHRATGTTPKEYQRRRR
jgi:AraC family transcriptional regulator